MLMPEKDPKTDLIMVATGTGIAPYRSFIRRLLFDDEWQEVLKKNPKNFKLDYALSREATNAKGGKMYIQDKVEEYADDIFNRLSNGAHIYFCGLKGMMPGIQDMLKSVCESKKIDYEEYIAGLKKND